MIVSAHGARIHSSWIAGFVPALVYAETHKISTAEETMGVPMRVCEAASDSCARSRTLH